MIDCDTSILKYSDFRILQETDSLILGYLWEQSYLINRVDYSELMLCKFAGSCDCGLIDSASKWAIVAGDIIAIWKEGHEVYIVDQDELKWVHDLRQKNEEFVELLIDPWSERASIWEININDFQLRKICDFKRYINTPYLDKIIW